jgi:lipoate synthase
VDQSVNGTAGPPRTTVRITWSKPLCSVRYVHPDEFAEYKILGAAMGFKHVESGPLVRSSYHAFDQAESARR